VGFGMNGRNLARAAKAAGIPFVVIEMNPETVRREREKGKPIFFGDATQEEILQHANIGEARIVVVAINDPAAVRRITSLARRLNAKVHIIVRTRYVKELQPLFELGANDVVPEEFETSVEIFTLVLKKYLIPKEEIARLTSEVRANCYMLFRGLFKELEAFSPLGRHLHDVDISTFRLEEGAPVAGKSLAQVELRKKHGVTVLAVRRNSQVFHNPDPDMALLAHDLLITMGAPDDLIKVVALFTKPSGQDKPT
jgi:CPA2 family monovalent cation:H+ antiporter-2